MPECLSILARRGPLPKEATLDADRVCKERWASGGRLEGRSGDDHMVLIFCSYVVILFYHFSLQYCAAQLFYCLSGSITTY